MGGSRPHLDGTCQERHCVKEEATATSVKMAVQSQAQRLRIAKRPDKSIARFHYDKSRE